MRKTESLFDHYCTFINNAGIGYNYSSTELNENVGIHEKPTRWKSANNNRYYRTRTYQSMLHNAGFLKNVRRGQWEILRLVPDWFTLAHLQTLAGYSHSEYQERIGDQGERVYQGVPRCNLTRDEILAKLNETNIKNVPLDIAVKTPSYTKGSYTKGSYNAFFGSFPYSANYTDPLYYASGAYAQEKENLNSMQTNVDSTYGTYASEYPMAKVEKITREESEFFKSKDSVKERDQLTENLRENIGLLEAATLIMDKVQILDPLVQGRVINIFEQIKSLAETVSSRIEYNRTKQVI